MYLINVETIRLSFCQDGTPYAILSHRWIDGSEFVYKDMVSDMTEADRVAHPGYAKVLGACKQAQLNGYEYIWIDTCCIDKSSSAELSEAINSMFNYYKNAQVCYAYLADLSPLTDAYTSEQFAQHVWFTRGWTLQELIAPSEVMFFTDREKSAQLDETLEGDADIPEQNILNSPWVCIGLRSSMCERLASITGIDSSVLAQTREIASVSVASRMSWAAQRVTSRVEDRAYCLLGLFDVSMPMLYGEGSKAFLRLQEEIMKDSNDESLFLWTDASADENAVAGLLAPSPDHFLRSGHFFPYYDWEPRQPFFKTNQGLQITLPLRRWKDDIYVAALNCCQPHRTDGFAGIYLKRNTTFDELATTDYHDQYVRTNLRAIAAIANASDRGNQTTFHVRQTPPRAVDQQIYPKHIAQLRHGPPPELGYRLYGTMGVMSGKGIANTSWTWVPKGITAAFVVPKKHGQLVAVLVMAREDESKFTVLLGTCNELGDVAAQVMEGYEEKVFGDWAKKFQPAAAGNSQYLSREIVSVVISARPRLGSKYFLVDLVIEPTPTPMDDLADLFDITSTPVSPNQGDQRKRRIIKNIFKR